MEWLEQMRAVFKIKVDALNMGKRKDRRGVNTVIGQLSKKSGIPHHVLRDLYFNNTGAFKKLPVCSKCGKNPVGRNAISGKPATIASKYFGLCRGCLLDKYKEGKDE